MNPYEAAIEVLEKHGWIQGTSHTVWGYCLSGALGVVAGIRVGEVTYTGCARYDNWSTYCKFFRAQLRIQSIPFWNDRPARTKEEVLEALRVVAKAWANK